MSGQVLSGAMAARSEGIHISTVTAYLVRLRHDVTASFNETTVHGLTADVLAGGASASSVVWAAFYTVS